MAEDDISCDDNSRQKRFKAGKVTRNPFLNFLRDYRVKQSGKSILQIARQAGERWRRMNSKERKPYVQQACSAPKLHRRKQRSRIRSHHGRKHRKSRSRKHSADGCHKHRKSRSRKRSVDSYHKHRKGRASHNHKHRRSRSSHSHKHGKGSSRKHSTHHSHKHRKGSSRKHSTHHSHERRESACDGKKTQRKSTAKHESCGGRKHSESVEHHSGEHRGGSDDKKSHKSHQSE